MVGSPDPSPRSYIRPVDPETSTDIPQECPPPSPVDEPKRETGTLGLRQYPLNPKVGNDGSLTVDPGSRDPDSDRDNETSPLITRETS